jgi:predicted peptidase
MFGTNSSIIKTFKLADIPEKLPPIQTPVSVDVNSNLGGFYKALPARYDSTTKKYPLLIFIHGLGELGNGTTDLKKALYNGVPKLINDKKFPPQFTVNGESFSFVVLSPQFKQWPTFTDVNALIDYAIANYRIDETRIYVSGLSMGGGVTWNTAFNIPSRLAAVVPICGAADVTSFNSTQYSAVVTAKLPVWAFHNNDDGRVNVSATNGIVDKINSLTPAIPAKKTIWPTGGHDAWTKATNPDTKEDGKNMYEWMLQFKRTL